MRFRKLRIAWTAFFGILCLLLIALWVRGYQRIDQLQLQVGRTRHLTLNSGPGGFSIRLNYGVESPVRWKFLSLPAGPVRERIAMAEELRAKIIGKKPPPPPFDFMRFQGYTVIIMKAWIPVITTGLLAALIGIPGLHRFSLRALLIATTLVAVALGLVLALSG